MNTISTTASRYLEYMGLSAEKPNYKYLSRICHAHLNTFPFENVSKLISYRDHVGRGYEIPSFEQFVDGYSQFHFGGTCFTQNSNVIQLLTELGFDCYGAMLGENHMGIIVILDEERVFIDFGAAAPIFKPIRYERPGENMSYFGDDKVYLLPISLQEHKYKFVRYTDGKKSGKEWAFFAHKKYQPSDFLPALQNSFQLGATFMSALRCQLWQTDQNRNVSLVNNKCRIRYVDRGPEEICFSTIQEIEEFIAEEFRLPKLPVREAIDVLYGLGIDIFASDK
ncbi:arylamine N-acetyltransferase [Thermoactinomyces sp. DSM 45892]|uniref:arylamine N-acetyltransferase n=1 Tax=Thermoactinomyces sp. DSM 45892 TaxID=1882753 RepID=UPI00089A2869|nr:arylamine N-acetyltransferase [Thermoactinomyces sp. DSM 45892]SDZ30353.1 Arylamine N-acetyltransferase [Thermoactinomyces sp. DSM 45892]